MKRKNFDSPLGDVRGGVFIAIAEWIAQKTRTVSNHPRLWKPSVVVPVENPDDFRRVSRIIINLVKPSGRVYYFSTIKGKSDAAYDLQLQEALHSLKKNNIFLQETIITESKFDCVLHPALQCMKSSFLAPNIVFFTLSSKKEKRNKLFTLIDSLKGLELSYCLLWLHPKQGLGAERKLNVWLRDKSPNNDLAVLCALQFSRNTGIEINLCRVLYADEEKQPVEKDMQIFIEDTRLPANTKIHVYTGDFVRKIEENDADLNIMGMTKNLGMIEEILLYSKSSILFISSEGFENALL